MFLNYECPDSCIFLQWWFVFRILALCFDLFNSNFVDEDDLAFVRVATCVCYTCVMVDIVVTSNLRILSSLVQFEFGGKDYCWLVIL